jgi:hypothetical protein
LSAGGEVSTERRWGWRKLLWWRQTPKTDEYGREILPPGQTWAKDNGYCPEKTYEKICDRCGQEVLVLSGWCPEEHDCRPMKGNPAVFRAIVREEIAAALHSSANEVKK